MGQKVNSLGLRLGINKTWSSKWHDLSTKSYAHYLIEDHQIRNYLISIFKKKSIITGHIQINRSKGKIFISFPIYMTVDLNKNKAGTYSNSFWSSLFSQQVNTKPLEESMSKWLKKPIHLKLEYAKNYFHDSIILAEYVALQLENRIAVRNILKGCLDESRKDSSIRGIRIHCAGRLDGVEMAKNVWIKDGQVPLHTLHAYIDYATASAYTIYGVCGVKAWICFHSKNVKNISK